MIPKSPSHSRIVWMRIKAERDVRQINSNRGALGHGCQQPPSVTGQLLLRNVPLGTFLCIKKWGTETPPIVSLSGDSFWGQLTFLQMCWDTWNGSHWCQPVLRSSWVPCVGPLVSLLSPSSGGGAPSMCIMLFHKGASVNGLFFSTVSTGDFQRIQDK